MPPPERGRCLKKRLQVYVHTVSTDGQFTAILTKLEKLKCPVVVSAYIDAFHKTSLKRDDTVIASDLCTADEFVQCVKVDHCVKIVKNAHWLYEDSI